ncbi:hypothetical protein CCACVL1_06741, partial [Corchorus capsularis]
VDIRERKLRRRCRRNGYGHGKFTGEFIVGGS